MKATTKQLAKIIVFGFGVLGAPMATAGQILFDGLNFTSSGQSMWGSGTAAQLNIDQFLGVTWDQSATLGGITGGVSTTTIPTPHLHLPSGWECHGFLCTSGHFHNSGGIHIHQTNLSIDTRIGAEVEVNTNGKVGFQFGLSADSGSVDTQVTFSASLFAPDAGSVDTGEFFNLNPTSSIAGGSLATNFPELTVGLDAIVGVRASASATACVPPFGCASGSTGELGFADQRIPIISFNDPASPGQIKVLGELDPALFQFDSEISIPGASGGSLGGVTVHVPDINTFGGVVGNVLTSAGEDDLIKLTADLDGLALAPLGLPGGGVSVSAGILQASADLIDIDMGPILKIIQDFEFSPTLMVDLAFDSPVQIAGFTTPQSLWTGALAALPDIALISGLTRVLPTFSVAGLFTNNTGLGVDGIFQLDILKASFNLEALGLTFNLGDIGPLFQILERSNLFNSPGLYNDSFALGGFNSITGPSFLLSASTASVPEPNLLCLMLLGLICLMWRQTRTNIAGGTQI